MDFRIKRGYHPVMPVTGTKAIEAIAEEFGLGNLEYRDGEIWRVAKWAWTGPRKPHRCEMWVNGYAYLSLHKDGIILIAPVSRIVWFLFNANIPIGKRIKYIDKDIRNNAIENLEISKSTRRRAGKGGRGEVVPIRRGRPRGLTNANIQAIRAYRGKVKQWEVAVEYGISQGQVSQIQNRRIFEDVPDPKGAEGKGV